MPHLINQDQIIHRLDVKDCLFDRHRAQISLIKLDGLFLKWALSWNSFKITMPIFPSPLGSTFLICLPLVQSKYLVAKPTLVCMKVQHSLNLWRLSNLSMQYLGSLWKIDNNYILLPVLKMFSHYTVVLCNLVTVPELWTIIIIIKLIISIYTAA